MAFVICEPCVGVKDRACVAVCPVDCIYEVEEGQTPDMLYINPDECIDCGLCKPECPRGRHLLRGRSSGPVEGVHRH